MNKTTLVLGASPKGYRNSNQLTRRLHQEGFPVIAVGRNVGDIDGVPIQGGWPELAPGSVDTVTVYLNAANQKEYYDRILSLRPRRLIFNPGAENPELGRLASDKGIQVEFRCSQVMMAIGEF